MKISKYLIVIIIVLNSFSIVYSSQDINQKLQVYTDTLSAGWSFMDTCIKFTNQIDSGCNISWTVIKTKAEYGNKEGSLTMAAHPYDYGAFKMCPMSFNSVIAYQKIILDSIFSRWPPSRFKTLSYSSFRHGNDFSWNIPIAIQSAHSSKYRDYRTHYPNTKYSTNSLFVEFANETSAYKELKNLFSTYGLDLILTSVEKVFSSKISDVPFKDSLITTGLKPSDRILWDVGSSYFRLSPIEIKSK